MPSMHRIPLVFLLCVPALAAAQETRDPSPLPAPPRFEGRVDDPMLAPMSPAEEQVGTWEEALSLVRERSTDLRRAESQVTRARGQWRQSLSGLLPNANLSGGVAVDLLNPSNPVVSGGGSVGSIAGGGGGITPTTPLGSANASVNLALVDVAAWQGLAAANAAEDASKASLQDVHRRITQGLAQVLVSTVAAERAAELNRVGLRQALERHALATRSLELGASTQLDAVRVAQDVAVAREALVAGDEALRRAREALGIALGREGPVGVSPDFNLDGLISATQQQCAPLSALTERRDLVASAKRLEAAERSRSAARAGYLPRLGLQSSAFGLTTSPGPGRILTWNLAAVLTVPLWEGGRREGLVQERQADVEVAEQTYEQARRDLSVEAARSRRGVDVAEDLLRTAVEARELADQTDRLTRRSFEVGRGSSLELVQSGAALRRAELAVALREFELVQARLDAFLTEAKCDW